MLQARRFRYGPGKACAVTEGQELHRKCKFNHRAYPIPAPVRPVQIQLFPVRLTLIPLN